MKRIELPRISERIRGFTLPVGNVLHVFDYDEVFRIDLQKHSVEVLALDPYAFDAEHPEALGVSENQPLLRTGSFEISYSFAPDKSSQTVKVIAKNEIHELSFPTLSGDWFIATLTADERYLLMAEPYLLAIYALNSDILDQLSIVSEPC
ncbi:hypothetical protein [Cupriavidus pauculus]|uniref:hypothetical protein n=1 Tax=Cupriavidus pauculus TaxID=82633 RepID=UPI00124872A2|nr:hypothetical protein [Cupriavidus pauculus]KAB0599112.1 hypothetical protein F7R19_24725 [Cupriavidus pauculus]UAL01950.1 hypothetical protein K8O84_24355 [Cupriavidus pauculus]